MPDTQNFSLKWFTNKKIAGHVKNLFSIIYFLIQMYLMLEIHCQFVWLFALLLQQVVNYQGQQPGNECPTKGKKINLHYNILQFIKHDKELKNK